MSNISNAPPLPRGQMPIEEVFRMMWARMNYLENALKEGKNLEPSTNETNVNVNKTPAPTPKISTTTSVMPNITVSQLQQNTEPILSSGQDIEVSSQSSTVNFEPQQEPENNISLETQSNKVESNYTPSHQITPVNYQPQQIQTNNHDEINELWDTVNNLTNTLRETSATLNETIDNISADLSEMNAKYPQMNNFLMEIQTTQITVNNQILRHYTENCSDEMESAIEKSASEKFANKNDNFNVEEPEDEEVTNENVEKSEESVVANSDVSVSEPATTVAEVLTAEETTTEEVTKESKPAKKTATNNKKKGKEKANTMSFNIQ